MKAAEPSRGCDRVRGRGCDRDAPAAENDRQKVLRNARQRRYRERQARCQAVGRFTITEDLVTALIATGTITEREAMTIGGIEQGVATILGQFNHSR